MNRVVNETDLVDSVETHFAADRRNIGIEPSRWLARLPASGVQIKHRSKSRAGYGRKRRQGTKRVDEPHLLEAVAARFAQAIVAEDERERLGA